MSEQKELTGWPPVAPDNLGEPNHHNCRCTLVEADTPTGPDDWDPPDPRWPPIQVDWDGHVADADTEGGLLVPPAIAAQLIKNARDHTIGSATLHWAMPPCTPSRRETLTGGLTQIWNGAKQVIGALKP